MSTESDTGPSQIDPKHLKTARTWVARYHDKSASKALTLVNLNVAVASGNFPLEALEALLWLAKPSAEES